MRRRVSASLHLNYFEASRAIYNLEEEEFPKVEDDEKPKYSMSPSPLMKKTASWVHRRSTYSATTRSSKDDDLEDKPESPSLTYFLSSKPLHHLFDSSHVPEHFEDISKVIACKDKRQELINRLLMVKGDYIEKIRFCGCVMEFSKCEDAIKKEHLGERIVSLFLERNAMFRVGEVNPKIHDKLLAGHYEYLDTAKSQCIVQLCDALPVVTAVKSILEE